MPAPTPPFAPTLGRRTPRQVSRAVVAVVASCLVVGSANSPSYGASSAAAEATHDYQLPFACGDRWQGTTRPDHSPTPLSIDWNRDANDLGQPALASAPGTVLSVRNDADGYGNYVVVDHGSARTTYYAHLSATLVVTGQHVDQGQLVGLVGSTGRSSGPHLHYEQRRNGASSHAVFDGVRFQYGSSLASGNCVDLPVVGDWNGDRRSDVGVFGRRPGTGVYRLRWPDGAVQKRPYGASTETPLVGDWDGDGDSDLGRYNPLTRTFALVPGSTTTTFRFGLRGDLPISGDWDGDGIFEVGLYRPGQRMFLLRSQSGTYSTRVLGTVSSLPVAGDWNGDGRYEVGVYDAGAFTLLRADGTLRRVALGGPGSLPVVGKWGRDAVSDFGTWDGSTGMFTLRFTAKRVETVRFGRLR